MTDYRGSRLRPGALVTAAAAGLIGVGVCAAPASAHTPAWTVTCDKVSVDLTSYNPGVTNTVTVTVGGKDLLRTETFKSEFHKTLPLPGHRRELTVRLVVRAGDDERFSRDETKTAPVCETTPSPSTTPPSPSASSSEKPPATSTPSHTAAAPAPAPRTSAPADLAETGASSSTPLIAGTAVVVLLAGGGIVFATRRRRTNRS